VRFALLTLSLLFISVSQIAEAQPAVTTGASVATKLAKKAAISYKCTRTAATAPTTPDYSHCFKMIYRKPAQNYSFKVAGCSDSRLNCKGLNPGTSATPIPAADLANADAETLSLPSSPAGVVRKYSYYQRDHLWCLDPNPPKVKVNVADPNDGTAAMKVIDNCRPYYFTYCFDATGNSVKASELADMPTHLCNQVVYEKRWYELFPPVDTPPILPP
jgi:hypothetical protein